MIEQRIVRFFESIEHILVSIAVILSPWLADLVVAGLAVRNVQQILAWPLWLSVAVGVGLEGLGMATAGVALELRRYNQTRDEGDPAAPVALAWALVWMQFLGSVVLALLNTVSGLVVWAIVAIPVLGGGGTLAQMLHDNHKKLLADQTQRRTAAQHAADLAQRRADRAHRRATLPQPAQPVAQPVDTRAAILAAYQENPHATLTDVAQQCNVTRQAVAGHLQRMEATGTIRRNGHGVEVL